MPSNYSPLKHFNKIYWQFVKKLAYYQYSSPLIWKLNIIYTIWSGINGKCIGSFYVCFFTIRYHLLNNYCFFRCNTCFAGTAVSVYLLTFFEYKSSNINIDCFLQLQYVLNAYIIYLFPNNVRSASFLYHVASNQVCQNDLLHWCLYMKYRINYHSKIYPVHDF